MARAGPTIQQIADYLGLSKFSVSRALSGKSGVSEATRERVRGAAEALRQRSGQRARQVLFITEPDEGISGELLMAMLHGAEREGARTGLTLLPREARHLGDLGGLDPAVCGVILALADCDRLAAEARRVQLPAVVGGYASPLQPVDQVVGADWEAGIVVGRYLTGLGHRGIGYVRGRDGLFGRRERLRGLKDGATEAPGTSVHEIGFDEPGGFRGAFLSLLRAGHVTTALFCAHDGLAVTVVSELVRMGIRVPEDVSVVGFFDFAAARQIVPPLTTVRIPQEEIGAALIRCLVQRISEVGHDPAPAARLTLMAEFVERSSAGHPGPTKWAGRALRGDAGRR